MAGFPPPGYLQLVDLDFHSHLVQNGAHALGFSRLDSTLPHEICGESVNKDKVKGMVFRLFKFIHNTTMTPSSFFKKFIFIIGCGQPFWSWAQPDLKDCVWTQFEHANGSLASEGCFVEGLPAGIWKSYDSEGGLLSEGARKNNQPHGVWKFYQDGLLSETTAFNHGLKEGWQTMWSKGVLTDSVPWLEGKRQGVALSFREDGTKRVATPFVEDLREGKAVLYNANDEPHGYKWFKEDRLVASERFNRFDDRGRKTGPWKVFHPEGRLMETGFYQEDLKHGTFQTFDARGALIAVRQFRFGVEIVEQEEEEPVVEKQEMRRDNGTLESTVTYVDGLKEGVARRFDEEGNIVGGSVFQSDVLVGEGITSQEGKREGPWKEYWPNGNVRSEGHYIDGKKDGVWVFYREEGEKEQEGRYLDDQIHGIWTWWHPGGQVHREEGYVRGEPEGVFLELDTAGNVLVSGQYADGEREGLWQMHINDHKEEGSFLGGKKDGLWRHVYGDGQRQFEGTFSFGQPTGKHRSWHPNGILEEEGKYESGAKHKKWRLYDDQGSILHEYIYRYGKLRKVDGSKVDKRRDGKLKND